MVPEGEVEDIAAKKLALELAGALEGTRGVVDRLRIAPAERKGDGAIRDLLCELRLRQPDLRNCTIRIRMKGGVEIVRDVRGEGSGEIEVAVDDGVITIEGAVNALRLVLEMDPLVQADQILPQARKYVVTLEGSVRNEEERRRAEFDAWAIFAVDKVLNKLAVPHLKPG